MLDFSQYDFQARHQMLRQEYRDSVAFQKVLVARMRQASDQIGTWLVKVGKHLQTQATPSKLQGQS